MLIKPTVLVLGAGASKPFQFPTGVELSTQLVDQLQPQQRSYESLVTGFDLPGQKIAEFREAFFYSGKNSVDAFLEHRTEFLPIGKAATAAILVGYEHPWHLFRYDNNNWLRYLYNNLNTSFDDFGSNRLAIVTFNYDRTVEHFFFTSLKNTYGRSDDECRDAF